MVQASVLVKTQDLYYGLRAVERATAESPNILSHVLIRIDQKGLRLSATDVFVGVTSWVTPLSAVGQFNLAVPIQSVQRHLRILKDEEVLITYDSALPSIVIHSSQRKERIKGKSACDFPPVPVTGNEDLTKYASWRIRSYELEKVWYGVRTAVATDNSRPVLTSVHTEIEGSDATFVAADGFRMAIYESTLEAPVDEAVSFNVPARAVEEIAWLKSGNEPLHFRHSLKSGRLFCHVGSREVTAGLVQDKYPEWRKLVPDTYGTRIVVAHSELAKVLKVVDELDAESLVVGLRFDVTSRRAYAVLRGTGLAEVLLEVAPIQMTGIDAKTAVQVKYLKDALRAVEAESGRGIGVMMELNDQSAPSPLRPISIVAGNNCRYLIMPMQFRW